MRNFICTTIAIVFVCYLPAWAFGQKSTKSINDSILIRRCMRGAEKAVHEHKIDNFYKNVDSIIYTSKENRVTSPFFDNMYFRANTMRLEIASQQRETKGKKTLESALKFRQEIIDNKENAEHYAGICLILSHIYFYMEEYQQAINTAKDGYEKGYKELTGRTKKSSLGFSQNLAALLESKGNAEERVQAYSNALVSYGSAACLFTELYKKQAFNQPLLNVYNNMGGVYVALLDNKKALKYYKLTDSILEYAPKAKSYYVYKSLLYGNIGDIYSQVAKADTALLYQEKSMEFAKKAFQPNDYEWVSVYKMYASSLEASKRIEEAIQYYEKSIDIIQKNTKEKNMDYTENYNNLANIYSKKDKIKALACLQKALSNNIGEFQDSLDIFKNPTLQEKPKSVILLQNTLYLKAEILDTFEEQKYKKLTAETYQLLEYSLDKYQFETYFSPKDRLEYRNRVSASLAKLSAYYMRNENIIKTFEIAEKSKYYLLFNEHKKVNIPNLAYLTIPQIRTKIQSSQVLLEYAYSQSTVYLFAISKEKIGVYDLKITPDSLDKWIRKYRVTLLSAENNTKRMHFSMGAELYKCLLGQAQKNGFLSQNTRHLIVIPQGELGKLSFETLFAEVPEDIQKILPTREFGALSYNVLPYLIKRYAISYYPSATLAFMTSTDTKPAYKFDLFDFAPVFKNNPAPLSKHKAVIAQAILNERNENKNLRSLGDSTINFLEYSEVEANMLEEYFLKMGKKVLKSLHAEATEETLKANIAQARIVHLSTHSFYNSENSGMSGIIAHQPKESEYTDKIEDGMLYAEEIYNLKLNPELLIMSSCQGGLGKYVAGEGLLALNRAFMYAGVENIMFSLWKVNDLATKNLMIVFYKELLQGTNYAEALQKAKISLLENAQLDLPFFWAGFILNWKQ